jgi:hypothetical protein
MAARLEALELRNNRPIQITAEKNLGDRWGSTMAAPVTMEELLVSSLAQTDPLAKLLIEKGLITREEFMQKISEERAAYQKLLNPTPQ